jgi:hypothetical protein
MKQAIQFCVALMLGGAAFGQHGGSFSGSQAPARSRGAVRVNRARHSVALRHRASQRTGIYPYAYPAFDYGYAPEEYAPEPNEVFQPPVPQVIVQQRPHEVRSEIREYGPPAQGPFAGPTTERGEQPAFAIALADGSRQSANAVWVQSGSLHYVDSEDQHHQVPLSAVDRKLTRQLNRERNLNFWLPAAH